MIAGLVALLLLGLIVVSIAGDVWRPMAQTLAEIWDWIIRPIRVALDRLEAVARPSIAAPPRRLDPKTLRRLERAVLDTSVTEWVRTADDMVCQGVHALRTEGTRCLLCGREVPRGPGVTMAEATTRLTRAMTAVGQGFETRRTLR